jgi:hypothetical protein
MKPQELKIKQTEKLNKQLKELTSLKKELEDKRVKDIANYGKPLGAGRLETRIEAKKRAVNKTRESLKQTEEKLNRKFQLPKRDKTVLSAIRKGTFIANTSTSNEGSRYDNRYNGSMSSRRNARRNRR